MAVALIALFSSLGGAGYAATTLTTAGARPRTATALSSNVTGRGPRGPRGFRGARGLTGPRGAAGSQGAQGAPGAPAVLNRTRLDFRPPHANVSVSNAYEQVESIGTVTKLQAGTVLRVAVNDTVGADGLQGGAVGCALQLRIDGVNDTGSSSTNADTGSEAVIGAYTTEIFPATIVTDFTGLPAGTHTLSLWLRAPYIRGGGYCYEGYGADLSPVSHTAIVEEMQ